METVRSRCGSTTTTWRLSKGSIRQVNSSLPFIRYVLRKDVAAVFKGEKIAKVRYSNGLCPLPFSVRRHHKGGIGIGCMFFKADAVKAIRAWAR